MRVLSRTRVGAGSMVTVIDDRGRPARVEFATNPAPTDADVIAAVQALDPPELVGATRAQLEPAMVDRYAEWRRWHDTHAEAVVRAMPAAVITALLARRDAAWTDYVTALTTWRAAPP